LLAGIAEFGPFSVLPRRGFVSLRRGMQFATVGPVGESRIEINLRLPGIAAGARLVPNRPGSRCPYLVQVGGLQDLDAELFGWLRRAYLAAQ
jgi:hypothetical protein